MQDNNHQDHQCWIWNMIFAPHHPNSLNTNISVWDDLVLLPLYHAGGSDSTSQHHTKYFLAQEEY